MPNAGVVSRPRKTRAAFRFFRTPDASGLVAAAAGWVDAGTGVAPKTREGVAPRDGHVSRRAVRSMGSPAPAPSRGEARSEVPP